MICATALVLLLDASASISTTEWAVLAGGHASALTDERVVAAIQRAPVAVTATAFADRAVPFVGWAVLRGAEDAAMFAHALRVTPRPTTGGTSIGAALLAGLAALRAVPCEADSLVIDLVTDGEAPAADARAARDEAEALHVTINALGVGPASAEQWLRENAATSTGSVLQVAGWGSFAEAIRRKISLEIAGR